MTRSLILLSILAGWVDTAGFVSLDGLFTAHVTGNLVVAGAMLAGHSSQGIGARLGVIPAFCLSVMLTTWAVRRGGFSAQRLLAIQASLLLCFAATGLAYPGHPFEIGALGVFAMGIQNTLMRTSFSSLPASTVMTGNVTQFLIDLTMRKSLSDADKMRMRRTGYTLLSFLAGAALGAFGIWRAGFASLLLTPLLLLPLLFPLTPQT